MGGLEEAMGVEPAKSSTAKSQASAVAFMAGAGAAIAWVVTFTRASNLHTELTDISENRIMDASAIQISQVADQSQLELQQYFAASFGLTVVFVLAALWAIIAKMTALASEAR